MKWQSEVLKNGDTPMTYYDSCSGKPVFIAPKGRSAKQFISDSMVFGGFPSFTEDEIVKENVQVDKAGNLMTLDGARLGEKSPDGRYIVNLSGIAGNSHWMLLRISMNT